MRRYPLYILLAALTLASCEVEFSPNAEWKEIPVVYCLIDQDDSLTTARVERCYLPQGDIYSPSVISDSINYAPGTIEVALLAFDSTGRQVDSIALAYTTVDREPGSFVHTGQPVYQAVTQGRLRENWRYRICVRHTDDHSLVASSSLVPLIGQVSQAVFNKPAYTEYNGVPSGQFSFNRAGATCLIEWDTLQHGRLYQPVIRLYYSVHGDTTYVDIRASEAVSRGNQPISISYGREAFLGAVRDKLKDDTTTKRYLKQVDLYLSVGSEDYNAYHASLDAGANISQGREPYTNIEGGLGVFASRRTHLHKWMPADSSTLENGLPAKLRGLGVGFE